MQVLRVVEDWDKKKPDADVEWTLLGLKSMIGTNMKLLSQVVPALSSKDLCVCIRDTTIEVWTMRAFDAETLLLVPETSEYKDRYWTAQRCVWLENSPNLHPNHKHMVLDGRLRANPEAESRQRMDHPGQASTRPYKTGKE